MSKVAPLLTGPWASLLSPKHSTQKSKSLRGKLLAGPSAPQREQKKGLGHGWVNPESGFKHSRLSLWTLWLLVSQLSGDKHSTNEEAKGRNEETERENLDRSSFTASCCQDKVDLIPCLFKLKTCQFPVTCSAVEVDWQKVKKLWINYKPPTPIWERHRKNKKNKTKTKNPNQG